MNNEIIRAITSRFKLGFGYSDAVREVEPHAMGVSKKGEVVVRAWERTKDSTASSQWKLYKLSEMTNLVVLPSHFEPRYTEGYTRGDKGMTSIHAEI